MLVNDERKVDFVYFLIKIEYYMFSLLLFRRDSRHTERPLDFSHCYTVATSPKKRNKINTKRTSPYRKKEPSNKATTTKKLIASHCQRNGKINLTERYKVTEIFYCCFSFDVINGYFSSTEKKNNRRRTKKKLYLFAAHYTKSRNVNDMREKICQNDKQNSTT